MKPSERISELLLFQDRDYSPRDEQESRLWDYCIAIMDYLDEEAEKPKYVCPNCHRVVDEIIRIRVKPARVPRPHCAAPIGNRRRNHIADRQVAVGVAQKDIRIRRGKGGLPVRIKFIGAV